MTTTVITGAVVGSRRERAPAAAASVVVDGEAIVAVERNGVGSVPRSAEVVDARGLTLLPGFIDCHVHIGLSSPNAVLSGGVTTVRDLAWTPAVIYRLARASRVAGFDGPEILAAGPMLTVAGGYPTMAPWAPPDTGRVVASPEGAARAVEEEADAGACVIKVALNRAAGPTLSPPVLASIVEAAHARGLRVTAHIFGLDELVKGLDAGIDELAHLLMSPEQVPDHVTRSMVEADVTVVPTMACFFGRSRRIAIVNLAHFREAGGRVVYGTDLGNRGPGPGIDRREIAGMAAAGYSSGEIVRSATTDAATYLGLEHAGAIEPGHRADIVAIDGRPLENPRDLTNVRMVWGRGRRVR